MRCDSRRGGLRRSRSSPSDSNFFDYEMDVLNMGYSVYLQMAVLIGFMMLDQWIYGWPICSQSQVVETMKPSLRTYILHVAQTVFDTWKT